MSESNDRRQETHVGRAKRTWAGAIARAVFGLFGALVSLGIAAVLVLAIALSVSYPNLPEISSLTDYRPKLPMRIFSSDGVLLGEFGEERRNFLPISQIPKVMQDAVLAAEDAASISTAVSTTSASFGPDWPISARREAPRAHRPSRCKSPATSISRPKKR